MDKTHLCMAVIVAILAVGLSICSIATTGEEMSPVNNRLTGLSILLSALGFLALGVLAVSYAERAVAVLSGAGQLIGALPGLVVAALTIQQPETLTDTGRLALALTDPLLLPTKFIGIEAGFLTPIYSSHSSQDAVAFAWIIANCTNIALWGSFGLVIGLFIRKATYRQHPAS